MSSETLADLVRASAREHDVPGVAVGVLTEDRQTYAAAGVRNLEDPAPVDERTLFHAASVTKTFTATAIMRLVAEERVELAAPVRRYVPELRLPDEAAAATITVHQLLNHTAGLDWSLIDTGEEDDSLAGFVARMSGLAVIARPGARSSYSQAGYNLVGRIVENVTGMPFDRAMTSLVLQPAGLGNTFFDLDEVLIRPFAVGHNRDENGVRRLVRPWKAWRAGSRGNDPGGGIVTCASDLIRWARFQLRDGDGLLPRGTLRRMWQPTIALRGSSLGDAVGIGWFLRTVDGVRTIGHGGSGNGQYAELLIAPERDFAVVSMANGGPEGASFNRSVVRWALRHHLGVIDRDPVPLPYDPARAAEVSGRYRNDAMYVDIARDGRRLTLEVDVRPEVRSASRVEMPPGYPPAEIRFLPDDADEFILTEGGMRGQRGFFGRDGDGAVVAVDLAGRTLARAPGPRSSDG